MVLEIHFRYTLYILIIVFIQYEEYPTHVTYNISYSTSPSGTKESLRIDEALKFELWIRVC